MQGFFLEEISVLCDFLYFLAFVQFFLPLLHHLLHLTKFFGHIVHVLLPFLDVKGHLLGTQAGTPALSSRQ